VLFISITLFSCFIRCFLGDEFISQISKRSINSIGPVKAFSDVPFVALIVAGGVNNTVMHVCSGSILNTPQSDYTSQFSLKASYILTSAYCILDRIDPGDASKLLVYKVLIENPVGAVNIKGVNFTVFSVLERIRNPGITVVKSFRVNVTFPPSFDEMLNISVNINDVGIMILDRFIDIPSVVSVSLGTQVPQVGSNIHCLGYGFPNLFQLHTTDKTGIIPSVDLTNGASSTDTLFFHDSTSQLASTLPSDPLQAIETGDEGCPLVDDTNLQVGIGQATWRVQQNNSTGVTLASLGPQVHAYKNYIENVLASFTPSIAPFSSASPTDTTMDNISSVSPTGTVVQSSAISTLPMMTLVFLVFILNFLSS